MRISQFEQGVYLNRRGSNLHVMCLSVRLSLCIFNSSSTLVAIAFQCSCNLDLDPITFIYELDPYPPKMY